MNCLECKYLKKKFKIEYEGGKMVYSAKMVCQCLKDIELFQTHLAESFNEGSNKCLYEIGRL